jgi:phage N-6-adenine-methyltransferase
MRGGSKMDEKEIEGLHDQNIHAGGLRLLTDLNDYELTRQKNKDLQNYNPIKGLKTIATVEVAEKYFERAKDATGLYHAVETKLSEQRKFILWWDGQEKHPGSRKGAAITDLQRPTLEDLKVDGVTLHRWRIRLKDEKNFDAALEAAQERCRRVCEAEKGSTEQKGASGTGENEWYTPTKYIDLARRCLGEIELDPASSEAAQRIVKATKYFTKANDALKEPWHGRVWLNPPYAQPYIADFVSKLVEQVELANIPEAILLTHNYTDTEWFHKAAGAADAICFTRGRIRFVDSKGIEASPTQGQAFFYFGSEPTKFSAVFNEVGSIVYVRADVQ